MARSAPATSGGSTTRGGSTSSTGAPTGSCAAARTSRRPRSRRCCSRQPSIADAAVVARRDEALGQVPVAAIVVRPDAADPGDDAILLACR